MNKTLTAILAIILGFGILVAGCGGGSPRVGEPAPDFQFQGLDGQPTSLSALQGSPVLINFWKTTCPPCVVEMPYLQQIYYGWQEEGLVLLAINIGENPSEVEAFMQSQGLFFPVLVDSDGAIAYQYGILNIPTTFFIDSEGIIQEVKVGAFQSAEEIEDSLSRLINVPSD